MKTLLSLDLSTSATGWSKWDLDSKTLISFGVIKSNFKNPKTKGIPKFEYPQIQLFKMRDLALQIVDLIDENVVKVVIEEINRGKNRLGQKTLDGFHFIVLDRLSEDSLQKVSYYDSDGKDGWRSANGLKLQLSEIDKEVNKERKKFNKKARKGEKKLPIITQKTLSCRFANANFNLKLDCDENETDGDVADSVNLGWFVLTKVLV